MIIMGLGESRGGDNGGEGESGNQALHG